jgi:hypothetical protein
MGVVPRLRVVRGMSVDIRKWAGSAELIGVETPFSREFIDDLKQACDGMVCRWDGSEKVWLVHPVSLPDVVDLCMRAWGRVDMDEETEGMFCEVVGMVNVEVGGEL